MDKRDKDVLSNIANEDIAGDVVSEEDDVLINELFTPKKAPEAPKSAPAVPGKAAPAAKPPVNAPKAPAAPKVQAPISSKPARKDARYTMSVAEIETLAAAAEDSVANGRFGAALDSVFFAAGAAREALAKKLNIRIPIGSADTDLPVIATAALIESYLEYEDINGEDIEEKLKLIIESSEDEHKARPSADQVDLRVFECALILCVQAEQCGNHAEIKRRLYEGEDSFLRKFLSEKADGVMKKHRREIMSFYNSVKLQSNTVSAVFEEYIAASSGALSFFKRFFAESRPVLITAISAAVLCVISIVLYIVTYSNIMSFIATDNFLMALVIVLEVLFCGCLTGLSWLVFTSGEDKLSKASEDKKK